MFWPEKTRRCGPIVSIFCTSYFFVKNHVHTEFHQNRSKTKGSSHIKSRRNPKSRPEAMNRSCPISIPSKLSSKPTSKKKFHPNRLIFTQVIVMTKTCVQRTAYRVRHLNIDPPIFCEIRVLGPLKRVKNHLKKFFFFYRKQYGSHYIFHMFRKCEK